MSTGITGVVHDTVCRCMCSGGTGCIRTENGVVCTDMVSEFKLTTDDVNSSLEFRTLDFSNYRQHL